MSWTGTSWAKATKGHKSYAQKLVLMALGDYHDTKSDLAWPSQAEIATELEMPLRTVQWCLAGLHKMGFISIERRGNQHQGSAYRLHFDVTVAVAEPSTRNIEHPQPAAPSQKSTRNIQQVYPQPASSEPAISGSALRKGTVIEPSVRYDATFDILSQIPGYVPDPKKEAGLQAFLGGKKIPESQATEAANNMLAKLEFTKGAWYYVNAQGKKSRYTNLIATLRTWAQRNGIAPSLPTGRPTRAVIPHDRKAYERDF